jgi:hemin uptake protein HemP
MNESLVQKEMEAPHPRRQVRSGELLPPGEKELWILHGHENYRLQLTKSGKLILTK